MAGKRRVGIVAKPVEAVADAWVNAAPDHTDAAQAQAGGTEKDEKEPIKRIMVYLPDSLHKKVKVGAAKLGVSISADIVEFLQQKYGNEEW